MKLQAGKVAHAKLMRKSRLELDVHSLGGRIQGVPSFAETRWQPAAILRPGRWSRGIVLLMGAGREHHESSNELLIGFIKTSSGQDFLHLPFGPHPFSFISPRQARYSLALLLILY